MTDFIKALKAGHEIVVIDNNKDYDSAIFYLDDDGVIHCWCRHLGNMKRTDLTFERLAKHLYKYAAEAGQVFVRGNR